MAAGAYRVVTLCAQLMRDPLAIAKFLVIIVNFFCSCDLDFRPKSTDMVREPLPIDTAESLVNDSCR